jgi:hypothetical protein
VIHNVWFDVSHVFDDAGAVRRPFRVLLAPAVYAAFAAAALAATRRQ